MFYRCPRNFYNPLYEGVGNYKKEEMIMFRKYKELLKDVLIYVVLTIVMISTLQYGIAVCAAADILVLTVLVTMMCAATIMFITFAGVYTIYYDYKRLM